MLNKIVLFMAAALITPPSGCVSYRDYLEDQQKIKDKNANEFVTSSEANFSRANELGVKASESSLGTKISRRILQGEAKIHTIFSAECSPYFDWQTVSLVRSFHRSCQPGDITRLLTCTEEDLKGYKGHDLAPTHYVPSMRIHPLTGDWYPKLNKPAAVLHWINHVRIDADYIIILDADMLILEPISPSDFNAGPGTPVATPSPNLIGCDNELAKIHTKNANACSKIGGVIIMHARDVRRFALVWTHKTEQLRADMSNWSANLTGDVTESGAFSSKYGYSFAAAELNFRHVVSKELLINIGNVPVPEVKYRVAHYASRFNIGKYEFDKAKWENIDLVGKCFSQFPDPPDATTLEYSKTTMLQRDLLSIQIIYSLNEALRRHHERRKCRQGDTISTGNQVKIELDHPSLPTDIKKQDHGANLEAMDEVEDSLRNESSEHELSPPFEATGVATAPLRAGVICLWVVSVFLFVAVMWMIVFSRNRLKNRKTFKSRKKAFHGVLGGVV